MVKYKSRLRGTKKGETDLLKIVKERKRNLESEWEKKRKQPGFENAEMPEYLSGQIEFYRMMTSFLERSLEPKKLIQENFQFAYGLYNKIKNLDFSDGPARTYTMLIQLGIPVTVPQLADFWPSKSRTARTEIYSYVKELAGESYRLVRVYSPDQRSILKGLGAVISEKQPGSRPSYFFAVPLKDALKSYVRRHVRTEEKRLSNAAQEVLEEALKYKT